MLSCLYVLLLLLLLLARASLIKEWLRLIIIPLILSSPLAMASTDTKHNTTQQRTQTHAAPAAASPSSSSSSSPRPARPSSPLSTAFVILLICCFPLGLSLLIAYVLNSPTLFVLAGLSFSIQLFMWFYSSIATHSGERYFDLTGSLTFIALTVISYHTMGTKIALRQFLGSCAIIVWAFRLGFHLFTRVVANGGQDRRFDAVRAHPGRLLIFWSLQGLWVFMTGLPVWYCNTLAAIPIHSSASLNLFDILGFTLWFIGLSMETVADYEKAVFNSMPENKGEFIRTGLWSLSRHPNYAGEIVLWFGLFVSMTNMFSALNDYLVLVLSPLFVAILLTRVSGIPPLEKAAERRWGKRADYIEYKKNTPMLIPFIADVEEPQPQTAAQQEEKVEEKKEEKKQD